MRQVAGLSNYLVNTRLLTNPVLMAMQHEVRRRVAEDTVEKSVALLDEDPTLRDHSVYADCHGPKVPVTILNDDCIQVALDAKSMGHDRVAVMNLASGTCPGGGYLNGAMAQEESICYRTTLGSTLAAVQSDVFPFEHEVIFTPNVMVIKDRKYRDLPRPETISVVSVTAHRKAKKTLTPDQVSQLERRIRQCLIACEEHKMQSVVLGALGCGVFQNNPVQVANCFRNVLSERVYVPNVYFAILEPCEQLGPLGRVFSRVFSRDGQPAAESESKWRWHRRGPDSEAPPALPRPTTQ